MGIFESFDYNRMARESENRLKILRVGLEKAKGYPEWTTQEKYAKYAKVKLLEEQIYEENLDLNLFRERAAKRRKS